MIYEFSIVISLIGGALTALVCANAAALGNKLGLMDVPDARKMHRTNTPLMGGVVLQFVFAPLCALQLGWMGSDEWARRLSIWLACVAAMTFIGIADDRHSLTPKNRLVFSFATFAIAAVLDPNFNIRILDFEHPSFELGLGTGWLAIVFTVVCGVGLVNAVNMADGKNGLVIGVCLGWLGLLSLRAPPPVQPMITLLVVVLLVLLAFNLPGRLFLGDGGAYGLASAIGLIAILTYNSKGVHAGRAISADELVLIFATPVIDSFRLTFVRLQRGQSPMVGDRDHLHHHLLNRFGWPAGLIVYFIVALLPGTIAILSL